MKFIEALKNWWNNASRSVRWVAQGAASMVVVSIVVTSVMVASAESTPETSEASLILQSEIPTPPASRSATPSPSSTPTPSVSVPDSESIAAPQAPRAGSSVAPQVNNGPIAPVFEPVAFAASQYGIGTNFDTGTNNPFPSGVIYASQPFPLANGTGPISYSVAGLPSGAGFDSGSRTVFIDSAVFFPANQVAYPNPSCPSSIFYRVRLSTTVQYTATGPGGSATISVPIQFGQFTSGAGMFHFGC